jgi:hypothetical protein
VVGKIYIAVKMPDVAAGSGGKSSESTRLPMGLNESKIFGIMHYIVVQCVS